MVFGVMVVTPWYITPNEEEAYDHYKAIRAELSIPLILYHNPYLTGCWLSEKLIARLYNDGIIDAIKDSAHDIYRHQNMRALCKDDGFSIFYGYDNLPAEALTMYADGWITGVGTLFPAETVHVYDLCKAGKPLEARDYIMTVCRKYMHFFNEPTQEGLPSPVAGAHQGGADHARDPHRPAPQAHPSAARQCPRRADGSHAGLRLLQAWIRRRYYGRHHLCQAGTHPAVRD